MPEGNCITDIHTHVLPSVDDGPGGVPDSLRLLEAHRQAGTGRLFCTSHLWSPHFNNTPEDLTAAFSTLSSEVNERLRNAAARAASDDLSSDDLASDDLRSEAPGEEVASTVELSSLTYPELQTGAELRVTPQLTDMLLQNAIPTLGKTSYVLLEYPNSELNDRMLDIVHELKVRGFRPIMAHPERSIVIQKDSAWIDKVLDTGMLLQLTASCLEKSPTSRSHMADRLAWTILERGAAAVIASDAHDVAYRPPGLMKAYEYIAEKLGPEVSEALIANANAIWNDEPVSPVPVPKRKRGLFRR